MQVQTILGDNKCQELWHLLKSVRKRDSVTLHDVVRYRREAERHVGSDDHLYKVDCVSAPIILTSLRAEKGAAQDGTTRTLRIQLLGVNDPSTDEDSTEVGRWREYVATYVMKHPTEWVPRRARTKGQRGPLYLKRCVSQVQGGSGDMVCCGRRRA